MRALPKSFVRRSQEQRQADMQRSLLHHLARRGGQIFGPIPKDVRREFFCLDKHTWVWHEEWVDAEGKHQAVTTRYDVRPGSILKSQGHNSYQRLTTEEEQNFRSAVRMYCTNARLELQRLHEMA